ncbi:MAG: HlyD family efflux transporter periplasmic adaptor subunit [Acetatifactor sp.]|nr:HlyD family efflux transporter periplasmic adaptor subunit [Acetatifactor sp.]
MDEKGTKRREWVKNAAIIFLTVLLVLTFFSRTIQNYSLPEVAAQYTQSGTITAKIRGTGVVESGDPYEVNIQQTRKVASVAVRVGDKVQQGDVLVYLEDAESTELEAALEELEAAKEKLRDARDKYNEALLTGDYSAEDIQAANGNTSVTTYRQQLTDAQNAVKYWEDKVAEIDRDINNIQAQLTYEKDQDNAAQSRVNAAKKRYDQVSGGDADVSAQAYKELKEAEDALAERAGSQMKANLESQIASRTLDLYNTQKDLAAAQKKLGDLTDMLGNMFGLDAFQKAISDAQKDVNEAQEKVDKELAKSQGAVITAPISGTVTTINAVAGREVSAATPVAILQPEGQGYTLSFTVTNEQARRLSVGDVAELVNSWRYNDVDVVLANIRPDTSNPGDNRILVFNVTGDVTAGQSLSVSVGQRSATYDAIVPNSAIREDNNGKFVLVVESRPSPLGNRYVATRMNVEVLASDDTQSAVSGLYGYEFVITTSTAPVEAGQLVRLPDNN